MNFINDLISVLHIAEFFHKLYIATLSLLSLYIYHDMYRPISQVILKVSQKLARSCYICVNWSNNSTELVSLTNLNKFFRNPTMKMKVVSKFINLQIFGIPIRMRFCHIIKGETTSINIAPCSIWNSLKEKSLKKGRVYDLLF